MTRRLARTGISAVAVFAVLAVAGTPALAKTKTKTVSQCVDANALIPNPGTTSAVLNVAVPKNGKKIQNGTVTAVQAGTRITHTDSGELDLTLVSPGGRAIALASEDETQTGTSTGYGSGVAGCTGSLVNFGDAFTTSISDPGTSPNQPITGSFVPRQPLGTFIGGPARGAWVLLASDCCSGTDSGVLNAFSLNVTYTYKVPKKKKK